MFGRRIVELFSRRSGSEGSRVGGRCVEWDGCRSGIGRGAGVGGLFGRKRPAVSVTRVAGKVAAPWRKGSGSDSYLADKPLAGCACVCCGLVVSALSNCEQQSSLQSLAEKRHNLCFSANLRPSFPRSPRARSTWGAL